MHEHSVYVTRELLVEAAEVLQLRKATLPHQLQAVLQQHQRGH